TGEYRVLRRAFSRFWFGADYRRRADERKIECDFLAGTAWETRHRRVRRTDLQTGQIVGSHAQRDGNSGVHAVGRPRWIAAEKIPLHPLPRNQNCVVNSISRARMSPPS